MQSLFTNSVRTLGALWVLSLNVHVPAYSQTAIVHQITLGAGQSWCEDSKINRLLEEVNGLRANNGIATLRMDA